MKNKPFRHKEANTFKFQPFSERISNLDINVYHRIGHENEISEEDTECLFYITVQKWTVLNLSEGFSKFLKEVNAYSLITLPQLVHNKDKVVETLLKYINYKDVMYLQPLLGITAALAEDLRKEFYPYFPKFLSVLIDLLHLKDADQVEWVFTCLAYIFKFLWKPLSKDISTVFSNVLPLLSDSKADYINNFAAESFSFVARKVNDHQKFLELILHEVQLKKDGISGCGKLLFEIINSSNNHFHSCSETWLPFLFRSLRDKYSQSTFFSILENVNSHILQNINPYKNELYWNTVSTVLNEFHKDLNLESADVSLLIASENIFKLIRQSIEFKNGTFLKTPQEITKQILKFLSLNNLSDSLTKQLVKLSVSLLLAKNIQVTQEQASQLIQKISTCNNKEEYLYFVENLVNYGAFEMLVLPRFLNYFVGDITDEFQLKCWHILTKILLAKAKFCDTGNALDTWNKYPIDFHSQSAKGIVLNRILNQLNINQLENYLYATICLPHLNITSVEVEELLFKNCQIILDSLTENEDVKFEKKRKLLLLLLCSVQSLIHMKKIEQIDFKKIIETLLPFCNDVNFIGSLKVLDFYLSAMRNEENVLNLDVLMKLNEKLEINFNSPFHEMRLLTSHIYSLFENLSYFESISANCNDSWKIFSIINSVESTGFQVTTFKNQLQSLEKLSYEKSQMTMCIDTPFKLIPLRYLCGLLYVNFQILWNPVSKLIATHAAGMETTIFWSFYGEQLKSINESTIVSKIDSFKTFEFEDILFPDNSLSKDKPDFFNYRILLWKCMSAFPEVAEARTRDTSTLLLTFVEKEYFCTSPDFAKTCDIKSHSHKNNQDLNETDVDMKEESEEESESIADKSSNNKQYKASLKCKEKTLTTILTVFSKFNSPKSMFREPELNKLYFDLLSHKNSEIQKLALDCLFTYRHEYLTAYKEHLYDLIDDSKFKNQLSLFRIDKESDIIKEEHRTGVIPIIIKIVWSKMTSKIGLRTGGKGSGQMRRNLVLRFLAGCDESEIQTFVHMTFRIYVKYLLDDDYKTIEKISEDCDLEKFIPPKRLQSGVNLLSVILEEFGSTWSNELLKFLLKILMVIGAHLKGAFSKIDLVHVGFREILKKLRASCLNVLEKIFDHFEEYPWSSDEMDCVFELFIWPYLPKLEIEGIHSPTSLLKLFMRWGNNPRYFRLFFKYQGNDKKLSVMPFIMNLLINKSTNVSVYKAIMEMLNNLLKYEENTDHNKLEIPLNNALDIKEIIPNSFEYNNSLNTGSYVVLPFANVILEKIKNKMQNSKKGLNMVELSVLTRISELVRDPKLGSTVLQLVISLFSKFCTSNEDNVLKFTTTINNLIDIVDQPQKHVMKLLPYFGEISHRSARKELCEVLHKISVKDENYKVLSNIVTELNAWDEKWIDQPNFERRSKAFKDVKSILEENLEVELGIAIIYNCYYTLRYENDISLKENSSQCWKNTTVTLLDKCNDKRNFILEENIFPIIEKGIKNKNEELRNECIQFLGHIVRECPGIHPILKDLHQLSNKSDLEVDFFENITHLQTHRHVRALLRFVEVFKNSNSNVTRALIQFIFPLVSWYLFNEKYVSKNSVVDAAIEALKVICKILPWHHYGNLLKYYIGKLRFKSIFQKQLVRIIAAILDAFHFDLSNGHTNATTSTEVETVKDQNVEDDKKEDEIMLEKDKDSLEDDNEKDNVEEAENIFDKEKSKEEIEESVIADTDPVRGVVILTKSAATKVINAIQKIYLPQLFKLLTEYTPQIHSSHKLNKKKTLSEKEEDDLQRIPISLALVKLLQKLPLPLLQRNLPKIFLKLTSFLKSHLESVRRIARQTFEQILQTIGPKYLSVFLDIIQPLLSKGFQAYVLVHTVHGVLACLRENYESGDIDSIVQTVVNICTADLFGNIAEGKEIEKIRTKTVEAKSTRSYETFQLLAQFVTEKSLLDLVLPLKRILMTSRSLKSIRKLQECFKVIASGLVANKFVNPESLMKFAYGMASQSIPELFHETNKDEKTENGKQDNLLVKRKADCFIIEPFVRDRSMAKQAAVKSSENMNNYVLVTFGINISLNLIKMEKIKDDKYTVFVDPFINIFKECLVSQHVKLNITAIKCLIGIAKYELPSFKENIKAITEDIFKILHKYAVKGLNKGDNFDLVLISFKFMSILVRDVKYYNMELDQLKILLFYVEQDLYENGRQINALMLLKAILSRKFVTPEIHAVMNKVAKMSIMSEITQVRDYCRQVFLYFFMDYPIGKKLDSYVAFYLSQINYELLSGRESALEMIKSLINSFPMSILNKQKGPILVALGSQLINDDTPKCRQMIANCLTSMFNRLSKPDRDPLFEMIVLWLKDEKVNHRRLAAQLCGILVSVEKASFESRLEIITPILLSHFNLKGVTKSDSAVVDPNQWTKDHYLFQSLQLLLKLSSYCPNFLKQTEEIEIFASYCQALLSYSHEWVRLAAAQFLGFVLSNIDIDRLVQLMTSEETNNEKGFLYNDPIPTIKSLTLDLSAQLQTNAENQQLVEQTVKNLVFIARILQNIEGNELIPDILWLIKRMRKISNWELVHSPKTNNTRKAVFKWVAGIGMVLDILIVKKHLQMLLSILVRDLSSGDEGDTSLKQLSKEVGNVLKKRVDDEKYASELAKAKQNLTVRQVERKRVNRQLAIADTELHARKKIKRNLKKKEAKKNKVAKFKGKTVKKGVKRKFSSLEET